jgi:peroxiredoxin
MNEQLVPGSTFPELQLKIAGDDTLSLPSDIETPYAVVLFYRGHW